MCVHVRELTALSALHSSYRRTSETLSQAGLKATAAFSNVGSAITKKFEDVRSVPCKERFRCVLFPCAKLG